MTLILIAEDDEDIRTVQHRLFHHTGYDVMEAVDGRTALTSPATTDWTWCSPDLDMPHLNGLQLCHAIRQDPLPADISVADLSGGLQPGDPRTSDAGVGGVLLKPFTNKELVTAVRRLTDTGHHQHPQQPCAATR